MEIAFKLSLPQSVALMSALNTYNDILSYLSRDDLWQSLIEHISNLDSVNQDLASDLFASLTGSVLQTSWAQLPQSSWASPCDDKQSIINHNDWAHAESFHGYAQPIPSQNTQNFTVTSEDDEILREYAKHPAAVPLSVLCLELFEQCYRGIDGKQTEDVFYDDWMHQIESVVELFESHGIDARKYKYEPERREKFSTMYKTFVDMFLWDESKQRSFLREENPEQFFNDDYNLTDTSRWVGLETNDDGEESIYIRTKVEISEEQVELLAEAVGIIISSAFD